MFEFPGLRAKTSGSMRRVERAWGNETDMLAVWMRSIFGVVLDLVEVVLVELTNEAGEVAVLEMEREDGSSERVHILNI